MSSPVGMRVPKGGSDCSKCKYKKPDAESCLNGQYVVWAGTTQFVDKETGEVVPGDEFCCNYFDWDPPHVDRGAYDVYAKRLARKKEG